MPLATFCDSFNLEKLLVSKNPPAPVGAKGPVFPEAPTRLALAGEPSHAGKMHGVNNAIISLQFGTVLVSSQFSALDIMW